MKLHNFNIKKFLSYAIDRLLSTELVEFFHNRVSNFLHIDFFSSLIMLQLTTYAVNFYLGSRLNITYHIIGKCRYMAGIWYPYASHSLLHYEFGVN